MTTPTDDRRDLLTVIAFMKAAPGKQAELRTELEALIEPTSQEDGFVNYDLHQGAEDPDAFFLYENWESDQHLDAHLATPHLVRFADIMGGLLDESGLSINRVDALPDPPQSRPGGVRREVAERMAEAAAAWLGGLDESQRAVAQGQVPGAGSSDAERRRWFYTPTDHGGLTLHQQRPAQQRAAMRLVATGLSTAGYVTVVTTMGLESILDQAEGFVALFDRERGRDPSMYYLRVFGDPGGALPWGWRFGGHHVSLNNLVVDGELVSTTPCFMGADPASSPLLGGALNRPLARVEDLALELVLSLSPEVAARAILLAKAPSDFVTANRTTVSPGDRVIPLAGIWRTERLADEAEQAKLQRLSDAIDAAADFDESDHVAVEYTDLPKGVAGADLDPGQRELLRGLLGTYFDRVPDGISPLPTYDDADLDAVHFAWAGPTQLGAPNYYRVQGRRLLIEWDNTQRGANHAHSVWRDPTSDFGLDVLADHRARHHPA